MNNIENQKDMQRMQQEAFKRVQEMQKRAKLSIEKTNQIEQVIPPPAKELKPPVQQKAALPLNSFFDNLLQDSEKCLILILILLLSEENCDIGLILALMYLII